VARELIIVPRFKRDYRTARRHPEFDRETLEYIFDVLISETRPPEPFRDHRLGKRALNLAGFTECHLGADLLVIYRVRRNAVIRHRIGTHQQPFATRKPLARPLTRRRGKVPT
jgi:addiction module RelE/StbE family toxin